MELFIPMAAIARKRGCKREKIHNVYFPIRISFQFPNCIFHFIHFYLMKSFKVPSKCRKCRFRDPNFKKFQGLCPGPPRIVSSLWPPPH